MTNFGRAIRELRAVGSYEKRKTKKLDGEGRLALRNPTEIDRSLEKRGLPLYLFRCWPEITTRICAASLFGLFLDLDGTIAKLQSRPADAAVSLRTINVLEKLVRRPNISISIVSGRRVEQLQRMIALEGIQYFGLHGAERQGKPLILSNSAIRAVQHAWQSSQSQLVKLPGVWVENKEFTFAVHYRAARPAVVESAHQILMAILAPSWNVIHLINGERVWEILPREIPGKGPAVRELFEGLDKGAVGAFFGNDETDEPAFAALPDQITVRVGARRRTRAKFYLHDPADVSRFLLRLEEELP